MWTLLLWTCGPSETELDDAAAEALTRTPAGLREVRHHLRVTHGSRSGGRWATRFSNQEGSHQSSLGLYRGGAPYHGKHGRSLRLDGLEPSNDAARERAIVVHGASYASETYVAEHGQAGRSWGCFAVEPAATDAVVDALRGGGLLLAWHPDWREETALLGCER